MLGEGELGRLWAEMRQELEAIATMRITGWCNNYVRAQGNLQQTVQMNELLKENERLRSMNDHMQSQLQVQTTHTEETTVIKIENTSGD